MVEELDKIYYTYSYVKYIEIQEMPTIHIVVY